MKKIVKSAIEGFWDLVFPESEDAPFLYKTLFIIFFVLLFVVGFVFF